MFISLPEFRFPIPSALAPPGATYWHTLTTSVDSAWFILRAKVRTDKEVELRTLLLWWDRDVVEVVDQLRPVSIESLVCVLPWISSDGNGGGSAAPCVAMREVWEAVDPERPDSRTILFIDENGLAREGLFADESSSDMQRVRLIARVADTSPVSGCGV